MKEREPQDDPLEPRRGRRIWPSLGLALAALALVYLVGWLVTGARFSGAIARLRAQGEPVRPSDMAPRLKPGERNAADLYEQAFSIAPFTALRQFRNTASGLSPSQRLALAQSIVASNQPYYDLLEEASRLDTCAFSADWDDLWGRSHEQVNHMMTSGVALEAKAEVQARRGDLDGALASCATALRVARHTEQAPSFGLFYASSIQGRALQGVEVTLSLGDPSPAAARAVASLLASRDHHALLARSLRLERASGLQILHWMEMGGWLREERPRSVRGVVRETYPVVAKPMWNADKQRYLEIMAQYLEAAQRPWPEAGREVLRLDKESAHLFEGRSVGISYATGPQAGVFARLGQNAALAGAWQVALALKAYHHDHHIYPASLADLEKEGWKLPRDPFIQRPYHYLRKGFGFEVWSVGFDGKDNGGRPFTGHREQALQPGTDFVIRCAR